MEERVWCCGQAPCSVFLGLFLRRLIPRALLSNGLNPVQACDYYKTTQVRTIMWFTWEGCSLTIFLISTDHVHVVLTLFISVYAQNSFLFCIIVWEKKRLGERQRARDKDRESV